MARVEGGAVIINTDWPGLKAQIDNRNVNFKYEEDSSAYEIFAIDGQYFYNTIIYKAGEAPQNQATFDSWRTDFETNYKNRITDFNSTQPFYVSNIDGYSIVLKDGSLPTANDGYGIAVIASDGTNYRMLKSDTSGRPILVGAGVAGTPAGGILSIQGVGGGTALPISGTVSVSGSVTTTNASVGSNASAIPTSSTQIGGSDGTNLQALRAFDADTGGGTQYVLGVGLRKSASGGSVDFGTSTDPIRIDPTGTTTQPVSGTVTANAGTGNFTVVQSTAANLRAQTASESATGSAPPATAGLVGGAVTTAAPTYTTGNLGSLSLTTAGGLRVDGSGTTQPVSGTVAATQSGTWTVQPGNTANTTPWLTTISQGGNAATVTASNALKVDGSAVTQPISGTITANAGTGNFTNASIGTINAALTASASVSGFSDGTNTQAARVFDADTGGGTQFVQGVNLRLSASGGSVEFGTATNPIRTDPTGTTAQPVSGTVAATQSGAWTVAATQSGTWTVQPGNTANTTPWLSTISQGGNAATVTASNALKVDGSAVTQPVSGTVTANAGTGTFTVSGTVTANIGTSGSLALDATLAKLTISQSTALGSNTQALVGGSVTTAAPTYTTGNINPLSLTTAGALRVDGSAVTQPISGTVTANAGTGTFTVAGTVTANIGTTNGLALDATLTGGTQTTRITDGTNTATVKAASTAAVAADKALVVAISPNNTVAVTGTVTATNPSVSATAAAPPASATYVGGSVTTAAPTYTTGQMNALSLTTGGFLRVDGSGVTQPISAASLPLPTGAATETTLGGVLTTTAFQARVNTLGQKTMANSTPVVLSSDQSSIPVTGTFFQATQPVSGTVTANIGTTNGLALDATLAKLTISQGTALGTNTQAMVGGSVTTAAPTYTTGQISPLSLTTAGALRTDASGTTQPVSGTVAATQSGTWTVQPGNTANTTPWLTTISQGGNAATVTGANALKVDGSAVTQPVSGTVTANIGTTNGLALDATLSAMSLVDNAAFTDGTTRVQPVGYIFDEVAGTSLTENDTAAARIDSKRAQIGVLEDATTRGTRATIKAASTAAVAGDTALVVAISPNNSISISGSADATATGTLNALNAAATLAVTGNAGVGFQLAAGTLIGTVVPEVSTDGGTTWTQSWFISTVNDIKSTSAVFPSSNPLVISSILGMNGASHVRVRVSAFTSGTANASLRASAFQRFNLIAENLPGIAASTAVQVGGSDGSALRALRVASDGTLRVDPTGTTTQPVSGTVTANIGTSGSLALEATQVKMTIAQSAALGANTQIMVGGSVTTAAPTYTTGNINPLSLTTTGALRVDNSGVTQPVSGTVTVTQGTAANLRAQTASEATIAAATGTVANMVGGAVTTAAPTYTTGQMNPLSLTTAGSLRTQDASAVAQASTTSGQTGQLMQGAVTTAAPTYTTAQTNPLSLTTTGALRVDNSGVTQPVSGTITANIGTSGSLALDASITAQSIVDNAAFTDGTTRVQPVGFIFDEVAGTALTENDAAAARIDSKRAQVLVIEDATTRGTRTTVKAASTAAVAADPALVVAISPNNSIAVTVAASGYGGQIEGRAADGAAPVGNPVLMGGSDGTNAQTILTDTSGRIIVAPSGSSSSVAGFVFGDIVLSVTGNVPVRRNTLTEQSSNAQRSVVSSSANDASAGTGARQIKITYYDSTGAGPSTETVTMNGTTPVNTVSTTICYVEKVEVTSIGSTGSNVGAITLKAATAGGGATILTISATDNISLLSVHYVPTGKTCFITGLKVGSNSSGIAQGGLYTLRAQTLNSATAPDRQISDFFPLFGQSSGVARQYDTPIQVTGPARIQLWVNPFSNNTVTFMGGFDFYDQ